MKKRLFSAFSTMVIIFISSSIVLAEIEWNILNSIDLDEKPVDVAISKDGGTTYILCKNSIKVHSTLENKITDMIPLSGNFSQITISHDGDKLLLTDSDNKKISIIENVPVFNIKTGDSPVIGKGDVPVNIVMFSDYQ